MAELPINQIICGDCLEVMHEWPAGCVDGVVMDPPYGIRFGYLSHDDSPSGYGPWLWSICELAESKCNAGAAVFVWQAMLNVRHFAQWFPRNWRLFAACKNFVQMRPCAMQYAYDPVLVWWLPGEPWAAKTDSKDYHIADTNPSCRRPGQPDYVEGHPCPRPLYQVQHVIEQWIRPNGIVLDPFCGSGTTCLAARRTGRRFIGIEKEEKYCQVARRRLAEHEPLFAHQQVLGGT